MKDNREIEVYACIKGFPNYLVTSHGRVLSLKDEHGKDRMKELKQFNNRRGYKLVKLYNNHKHKIISVHRLVAQAFIPNPENKPQVNHIDEDRTNNHVSNLEWATAKENCNHGTHNERVGKAISKIKSRKVMAKSLTEPKVLVFKSGKSAENFGFSQGNIWGCCNGNRNSHKGYTWHYLENTNKEEK